MSNPTASEIANYAREHGITLTQAMRTLDWTPEYDDGLTLIAGVLYDSDGYETDEVYDEGEILPFGRCDVCGREDSPDHTHA